MFKSQNRRELHHQFGWLAFLLITPVHLLLVPTTLYAADLPEGANVTQGNVTIQQTSATHLEVQVHDHSTINWNSFNISDGFDVSYIFDAPNLSVLNRDISGNISEILGGLDVRGGLWALINTAGIHIGSNATVLADQLIFSTLDLTLSDLSQATLYTFEQDLTKNPAFIHNEGSIQIENGFIAMIGGAIKNTGFISAVADEVGLAAGKVVTLWIAPNSGALLSIEVTQPLEGEVRDHQGNLIQDQIDISRNIAGGATGQIFMDARSVDGLFRSSINLGDASGATSVTVDSGGTVVLKGSGDISINGDVNLVSASSPVAIVADVDANGTGKFLNNGRLTSSGGAGVNLWVSQDSELGNIQLMRDFAISRSTPGADFNLNMTTNLYLSGALTLRAGTLVTNGHNLAANSYLQTGGIFEGAGWAGNEFTVNGGFTLAGGTFNAPESLLISGLLQINSGVFNQGSGNVGAWNYSQIGGTFNGGSGEIHTPQMLIQGGTFYGGTGLIDTFDVLITNGSFYAGNQTIRTSNDFRIGANADFHLSGDATILADDDGDGDGSFINYGIVNGHGYSLTVRSSDNPWSAFETEALLGDMRAINHLTIGSSQTGVSPLFVSDPLTDTFDVANFTIESGLFNRFSGSGTVNDPYLVYDVYGLQGISGFLSDHFALANDIDASGTQNWNSDTGFVPIGIYGTSPFTGSFDGQGYTIQDLYINNPTARGVGLFGYIMNAEIGNITLWDVNITGSQYVGALAGIAHASFIDNAHVTGAVMDTNPVVSSFVGGLVGNANSNSEITDSSSTATVTGSGYAGGLVGIIGSTLIERSFATGDVTGSVTGGLTATSSAGTIRNSYATGDVVNGTGSGYTGGLVAVNQGLVSNSYATGQVTGEPFLVGGLIANTINLGSLVQNSYWNTETAGITRNDGGTGLTSAQMQDSSNFVGWDFANVWQMPASGGAPVLQWQSIAAAPIPPAPVVPNPVVPDPIVPDPVVIDPQVSADPEPPQIPVIEDNNTIPNPVTVITPVDEELKPDAGTQKSEEIIKVPEKEKNTEYLKPQGTVVPENNAKTLEGLGDRGWNLERAKALDNTSLRAPPDPRLNKALDLLIQKDQAQESSKQHNALKSPHAIKNHSSTQKDLTQSSISSSSSKDTKVTSPQALTIPDSIEPTKVSPYLNRNLKDFSNIYNHGPPSRESTILKPYSSHSSSCVLKEVSSKYSQDAVFPALLKDHLNSLKTNASLVSQERFFYLTAVSNQGGSQWLSFSPFCPF